MKNNTVEELVLDAAEKLFGRYGLEKTSMDDIARYVRKSKRSLYNYFSGKEEIFSRVLQREINIIKESVIHSFVCNKDKHPLVLLKFYLLSRPEMIKNATIFCQVLKDRFQEAPSVKTSCVAEVMQEFNHWEHSLFVRFGECKYPETSSSSEKLEFATAFADMMQMALTGVNYAFFVENKYSQYKIPYVQLVNIIMDGIVKNEQLEENFTWNFNND